MQNGEPFFAGNAPRRGGERPAASVPPNIKFHNMQNAAAPQGAVFCFLKRFI